MYFWGTRKKGLEKILCLFQRQFSGSVGFSWFGCWVYVLGMESSFPPHNARGILLIFRDASGWLGSLVQCVYFFDLGLVPSLVVGLSPCVLDCVSSLGKEDE